MTGRPPSNGPSSMPLRTTQLTGRERSVAAHELFFSTTDRRGIIRSGNSVFADISGYSIDELVGSPHNMIRHPDMPAGAFWLMWDRLLSGRAMAAIVKNLAKDGSAYWVFATITPLDGGFLSVRMPVVGPLTESVRELYAEVSQYEQQLTREKKCPRPEAAAAGAAQLEHRLADLGYPSYEDFMLHALPAQVAVRGMLLATHFARPAATGPAAGILSTAQRLEEQLESLVHRLVHYAELITRLEPCTDDLLDTAHRLRHAVQGACTGSATVASEAPVLLNVAQVMTTPTSAAVKTVTELAQDLHRLRSQVAELTFRIALARLHTQMVGAFAADVIDRTAPASSLSEVPRLCDALHEGVQGMAAAAADVNDRLKQAITLIHETARRLSDVRPFLGQWRLLVLRHRQSGPLASHVGPIDAELEAAGDQLDELRSLAAQCQAAISSFDPSSLDRLLTEIRSAAASI